MKNNILTFSFCFICSLSFGQGIISDIMVVESVNIDLSVVHEKQVAKYNTTLEEETAEMEKDLAEIDKKYKDEVSKYVDDYSRELKDGEEQLVTNLKTITVSRVNSLTMTHRKDKKNRVQAFLNEMQLANRRLPLILRQDAEVKVKATGSKHFESIEIDYTAHLATVKNFEDQEHLVVTEGSAVPVN